MELFCKFTNEKITVFVKEETLIIISEEKEISAMSAILKVISLAMDSQCHGGDENIGALLNMVENYRIIMCTPLHPNIEELKEIFPWGETTI